jgi:hypothetical protein
MLSPSRFLINACCLDYCLANKGRAREGKLSPASLDLVIQLSLSVSQLSITLAISLQSCYAGLYEEDVSVPSLPNQTPIEEARSDS